MTRPRRSPIGYVFIALMSASLLSGCGTKFGSKLSEGTSRTLSGLKSGAKNVEKSLKGESDYEKEMAAVGRRFKRIPATRFAGKRDRRFRAVGNYSKSARNLSAAIRKAISVTGFGRN